MSCTSTARCTAPWLPSTSTGMPRACASLTTSLTGTMVPSAFDIWVMATSLVRGVSSFSNSSIRKLPSSSTGAHLITAPCRSRRKCHGTMLEWCSMIESTISSPSLIIGSPPNDDATRLIASVALRVKMISSLRFGVEELRDLVARALIGFGRGIGEIMQAAMHVGVFGLVRLLHAVEHGVRLLRRRGVVEIDQRLAIDLHARAPENPRARVRRRRYRWRPPDASISLASSSQRSRRDRDVAQPVVDDRFDRLADERLDQQRLRLLLRQAAGAQVEQQALVQRARGRAVTAGDVVGENLELRLVVGLGLVRQQQRAGHHLAVGLLRVGTDDDPALEHRMRAIVQHRAEHLAAGAVRHRVIDHKRGVAVLACRSAD